MTGELYQRAEECLRRGRPAEALDRLEQFLARRPAAGPAWNLAGRINQTLHNFEKAMACFERSVCLPDGPPEAAANLIRASLAAGKLDKALSLLRRVSCEEPLVLDMVDVLEKGGRLHQAVETLHWAKGRLRTAPRLDAKLARLQTRRPKLAVFCGGDGMTFFNDILDFLRTRYQVRLFEGSDARQMHELMRWSDVSWFEWCSNLAVLGSRLPKCCRTIIRLHRYEAYMPWPAQIDWHNIDLLVTVGNRFVIEALEAAVPDIRRRVPIVRIPNGVDLDRIPFRPRPRGKAVAFVASLRMVKNPMLLLQCMARLHALDPGYTLHIAGRTDDLLLRQYMEHQAAALGLADAVRFDGWQEDIPGWLADKHYLAVTSVIESQGMGILEAMASGLVPVIHNFPGAAEIYDMKYLFNTPDDFAKKILSADYNPRACREFVERRYPLNRTLMLIDELISKYGENNTLQHQAV
jgi:glycosyltransferase involved in cell wall biosynthesis